MLADGCPPTLLALGSLPTMLADGCPSTLLALGSLPTLLADGCPSTLRALRSLPAMLADGCPSTLLARGPIPVMLAFPYLSIPDGYLSFRVKIFPSLDPLRLLHRLTRDELFRLARHCHHKPAHGAIDSDGFY